MMRNITFTFPKDTRFARDFFDCLKTILTELPNSKENDGILTISAIKPKQAFPITNFCTDAQAKVPAVRFDHDERLPKLLQRIFPKQVKPSTDTETHDNQGVYYETSANSKKTYGLPIQELQKRLQGHITRIDHTGLNLPAKNVSREEWDNLLRVTAQACNVYRYPTSEPWPFILPATREEFEADITTFPVGREPKFELVHDSFSVVPTIQIDLETDLERPEIEQLFPSPYGISWPNLADYFRTVYVHHEWPGLIIRFDLRYKSNDLGHDWNTGKWLVTDGGRINFRPS